MNIRWSPDAREDRRSIWKYISADNPYAARRLDALFADAAESLKLFPNRGSPGLLPGTRELLVDQTYRMIYEADDDEVVIHALIHAARLWPPSDDGLM